MHKMLGRATLKQPPKLGVWKFLGAWHFLSLPPLGMIPPILPMHTIGLSMLTKTVFILRVAFHLTEIWDLKASKCWRYGLGRSPNLGMAKEVNISANIWKFLVGCMGHATWQRECTMLTGKVLSAWALLNKVTYIHTYIIPCKPTPITLSVSAVRRAVHHPCYCLMFTAASGWIKKKLGLQYQGISHFHFPFFAAPFLPYPIQYHLGWTVPNPSSSQLSGSSPLFSRWGPTEVDMQLAHVVGSIIRIPYAVKTRLKRCWLPMVEKASTLCQRHRVESP